MVTLILVKPRYVERKLLRVPGAAQHEAKRSDALQTRDRTKLGVCGGPGSAVHRIRDTPLTQHFRQLGHERLVGHVEPQRRHGDAVVGQC